jgi:hypothetical protein
MEAGQSEVCDDLRRADWRQPVDGLDLDKDAPIDDEVDTIAGVDSRALVEERKRSLTIDHETTVPALTAEAFPIRRLE